MPVYIVKSGDLVGCYRCLTHTQTDRQTSEYRATQLVSSIKHKLSHAIWGVIRLKDQLADLPQPFGPFSSNIQLKQLCKHICSFWPTLSISLQFWIFGGFSKILYIFFKFNSKILLSLFSSNVIFVARHYFSNFKNWLGKGAWKKK